MLLVPSAWGLTAAMKTKAEELADAGFSVLVPDLNDGFVARTPEEAQAHLVSADMNVAASLVQSSLRLLRAATVASTSPVGVVGYSSGASWALWLSERFAELCGPIVGFYGSQTIEFGEATSSYLIHFASDDDVVGPDDVALLGLNLQMAGRPFRFEQHTAVSHGFAESHHPNFDVGAEAIAWRQTLEFLAQELRLSETA